MTYPDHPPKVQPNRPTDSWAIGQDTWPTNNQLPLILSRFVQQTLPQLPAYPLPMPTDDLVLPRNIVQPLNAVGVLSQDTLYVLHVLLIGCQPQIFSELALKFNHLISWFFPTIPFWVTDVPDSLFLRLNSPLVPSFLDFPRTPSMTFNRNWVI